MSADMMPTSLYVGIIREMLPETIDNSRDAELHIKQLYDSLANEEISDKLREANRKFS
jgi:hypothetical protein